MRHLRRAALLVPALAAFSCTSRPPAPPPVREATPVAASFDKTWTAAIDYFANDNVPIATIERASGIIATPRLSVTREQSLKYADCGKPGMGPPNYATSVVYNVIVRGDSTSSTVKVIASWSRPTFECNTKGVWETEAAKAIKDRAEGRTG